MNRGSPILPAPLLRALILLAMIVITGAAPALPVFAAERAPEDAPPIASIEFLGNDRTRERVLRRAVEAQPGDQYTRAVAAEIRDDLRGLGLFSSVEVSPDPEVVTSPDGAAAPVHVVVTVEERWTLVPIPFFSSGSSGYVGGLFVLESNLLGYNKQLITGGSYGSDGFGGLLVYNDPGVLGSNWLLSLSASAGREDVETADTAYENRWSYAENRARASLDIGYRFGDLFALRGGPEYQRIDVSWSDRSGVVPPSEREFVSLTGEASVSNLAPEGYFRSGQDVSVSTDVLVSGPGWLLEASGSVNARVLGNHRAGAVVRSAVGDLPFLLRPRLGGTPTQRTLVRGTVVEQSYVSGGALYEIPVLEPEWATITLRAFYEGGYLASAEYLYHGGGGGLRLYLSRVTFPALGFDAAWNASARYPVFSFTFGGRI